MMTSSDQQQIVTESHQNSEKLYAERIDAVATTAEILVDVLCEEIDLLVSYDLSGDWHICENLKSLCSPPPVVQQIFLCVI
jgi:hypothetical protein